MIKFDVVVIGGGPAGLSAALTLAKSGMEVAVVEKGEYAGSKNVMGGVLYTHPLLEIVDNAVERMVNEKAVERSVIEQNMFLLGNGSVLKVGHRNPEWKNTPNAFTVLRAKFDQWFAKIVEEAGALVITKTKVEDFIWENGKIKGVVTSRPEGEIYCKAVIIAEGVNPILTMKAGLRKEDIKPNMAAVAVKEVIDMPEDVINSVFNVDSKSGVTYEILGEWSEGMFGMAFLYTNKDSVSVGCGVLIEELKHSNVKPYKLLENLKNHPVISDIIGEYKNNVKEYLAHLIPEGGYYSIPQLYGDNVLVCGDSAMLVNSIHREGSNHAITSGRFAAETLIDAFNKGEISKKTLKSYVERLKESFILKDLEKYKDLMPTMEKNKHFIEIYPSLLNRLATRFLNVDGTPKTDVEWQLIDSLRNERGLIGLGMDALKLWKGVR